MNQRDTFDDSPYKGYTPLVISRDEETGELVGDVIECVDVILYEGRNAVELRQAFEKAVDDLLESRAAKLRDDTIRRLAAGEWDRALKEGSEPEVPETGARFKFCQSRLDEINDGLASQNGRYEKPAATFLTPAGKKIIESLEELRDDLRAARDAKDDIRNGDTVRWDKIRADLGLEEDGD